MKKILSISAFLILVISIINISCKKTSTSTTNYTPTCNSTKSYSIDVKPIIQSYCVSCHSNYSSYSQISASASSIRNSIVNGSMPKGSAFTDAQKDKILCWIDAGSPNN